MDQGTQEFGSGWRTWAIDELGRVRESREVDSALAVGRVEAVGTVGSIEQIAGEPAVSDRVPTEVLDVLERRYPGRRWFVKAAA